jgi:hypothetical protein
VGDRGGEGGVVVVGGCWGLLGVVGVVVAVGCVGENGREGKVLPRLSETMWKTGAATLYSRHVSGEMVSRAVGRE